MNARQKKFADEYIKTGNAKQSAIKAGYAEGSADVTGTRLLVNASVKSYIEEQMEQIHDSTIADATEVLRYLTSVLRGESRSHEIVVEGCGDGVSEAKIIAKPPSEKDRLKSAELIGKRYGIYIDKQNIEGSLPVVLKDDVPDE